MGILVIKTVLEWGPYYGEAMMCEDSLYSLLSYVFSVCMYLSVFLKWIPTIQIVHGGDTLKIHSRTVMWDSSFYINLFADAIYGRRQVVITTRKEHTTGSRRAQVPISPLEPKLGLNSREKFAECDFDYKRPLYVYLRPKTASKVKRNRKFRTCLDLRLFFNSFVNILLI